MQECQPAFLDQIERTDEHFIGFGRKSGDDVAAKHNIRPQPPYVGAELDRVRAQMAALHTLEDEIVAGLQGEM